MSCVDKILEQIARRVFLRVIEMINNKKMRVNLKPTSL